MAGRKPPRSGGRAAPYDHTDTDEDIGALSDPDPILNTGRFLTPVAVAEMVRLVTAGVPVPTAATATGAGSRAKKWAVVARAARAAGRVGGWGDGESPELAWLEAMEQAKSLAEANLTMAISAAAPLDWKAAAWILERRSSRRWHLQSKLEISAGAGKKLEITSMSTERLLAIARGLLPDEAIRETKALPSGEVTDGELVDDELGKGEP
jgi:hypothetical protein